MNAGKFWVGSATFAVELVNKLEPPVPGVPVGADEKIASELQSLAGCAATAVAVSVKTVA